MKSETQIQRVVRMEAIYDESCLAVRAMLRAAQQYRQVLPHLQQLADYYQSGLWLQDFDAERAGCFPKDMKRGILTEDAIWDLLTDEAQMQRLLRQLPPLIETEK